MVWGCHILGVGGVRRRNISPLFPLPLKKRSQPNLDGDYRIAVDFGASLPVSRLLAGVPHIIAYDYRDGGNGNPRPIDLFWLKSLPPGQQNNLARVWLVGEYRCAPRQAGGWIVHTNALTTGMPADLRLPEPPSHPSPPGGHNNAAMADDFVLL